MGRRFVKTIKKTGSAIHSLLTIVWLVLSFLPAVFFIITGVFNLYLAFTSSEWPSTTSRHIYVTQYQTGSKVTYSYKVNGVIHDGDVISFNYPFTSNEDAELIQGLKEDIMVPVYYSPQFPAKSVLRLGFGWGWAAYLAIGLVFIPLGKVAFCWGTGRIKTRNIDPVNWG